MLTALDFPDELLYSPDAIWVRDDGAGSVRIGLNVFAACGDEASVYLVRLPRAGARLEKGKPFGHVDLERGTVDLVAPVTGTVFFVNSDLRADPTLLAQDPYGRGFLLELEDVGTEEVDALLDREDAVMRYSRFDETAGAVEGAEPLYAGQAYEAGRPWPSALDVRFGGRSFVRGRLLPPVGNEVFTPDWSTGDTWVIETKPGDGEARRFQLEVLGDGQVAQEEVVRVRAVEVALPGAPALAPGRPHRVLHFRVDDFTLAAWDEVPADDPRAFKRHYNPRGREAWLITATAPGDGFVIDHPRFPVSLDDEARDIPEGPDRKALPEVSHYVKFRGGLTKIEAEMKTDVEREDGRGTERLVSAIVFERGEPWWVEATRQLGGNVLVQAKLVRE